MQLGAWVKAGIYSQLAAWMPQVVLCAEDLALIIQIFRNIPYSLEQLSRIKYFCN